MRIRVSPQARADLDEIWLYVARQGDEPAATRLIDSIHAKFGLFAQFPYIGRRLEEERRADARSFPVGNHVVFYSAKPGEIRILRVIHASCDAWAVFGVR